MAQNNPAVAASNEEIITESETKIASDREAQQLDPFTLKRLYNEVWCHNFGAIKLIVS